jgi:hypothetical protein
LPKSGEFFTPKRDARVGVHCEGGNPFLGLNPQIKNIQAHISFGYILALIYYAIINNVLLALAGRARIRYRNGILLCKSEYSKPEKSLQFCIIPIVNIRSV